MTDIIVNTADRDPHAFLAAAQAIRAARGSLEFQFVQRADDGSKEFPGGWGCVRFPGGLPNDPVFQSPDIEYRYSETDDTWLANGERTDCSDWLKTLHGYFVSSSWGSL